MIQEIYLAGGCLWGVQEFLKYIPGIVATEAGRANGTSHTTQSHYDGYAECVRTQFNPEEIKLEALLDAFFEIIDPYSLNQQGQDIGLKYRTGIYSQNAEHLKQAAQYIQQKEHAEKIVVEVCPLTHYIPSDEEHQHHLTLYPEDHYLCHLSWDTLHKYKK